MKKIGIFLAAAVVFTSLSAVSFAEEYVEQGRFGVEGTISANGFQTGLVRETDAYEIGLDLDASTASSGNVKSGDIGVEARLGKRFNIGSFNYLSVGADAQTALFSKAADGTANNGSYVVGPYVGLQRHFSGTSLMLTLYVLPVDYNYTPSFGGSASVKQWQFFEQGAFGLAYLF